MGVDIARHDYYLFAGKWVYTLKKVDTSMNNLKTVLLLGALTGLFVAIGGMIGGRQGMVIALILAAAMNFFSYWYSDKMVLRMYDAQPVDEARAP